MNALASRSTFYRFERLPGGGLVFLSEYSALMVRDAGGIRMLLHSGERLPGCGTLAQIYSLAVGSGGAIYAPIFCGGAAAIVRVDVAGGAPGILLKAGHSLPDPIGAIGYIGEPAIDATGRIVVSVGGESGSSALIRLSGNAEPEILLASGTPLGGGSLAGISSGVDINAGGTMVFLARLTGGLFAIVRLTPGSAPEVLQERPEIVIGGSPLPIPFVMSPFSRPLVDDSGATFFQLVGDEVTLPRPPREGGAIVRILNGATETLVAPGDSAPDGGTFQSGPELTAVDAEGGMLFTARSSNATGEFIYKALYRFDGVITPVVEPGQATTDGEIFSGLDVSWNLVIGSDGSVLFTGRDTTGPGIFRLRDGILAVELRNSEPLAEPARFTYFQGFSDSFLHQTSGPFMAGDGSVIFDAVVTGRSRGLYVRTPDGALTAVALDGGSAPGGGTFQGYGFSFHSIARDGHVAFLGRTVGGGPGYGPRLYAGFAAGPLEEVIGQGYDLGVGSPVAALLPPSRIDSDGAIVIPVRLMDDRTFLLLREENGFRVLAETGDTLPDGEIIESIQTGASEYFPLAPLLGEDGDVVFGIVTNTGRTGLYRIPASGDYRSATRLLGDGDLVEGGALQPLRLQAMSLDPAGRLAFQAVTISEPTPRLATFLAGGPLPQRLAGPGDRVAEGAEIFGAMPRLAATAHGILHAVSSDGNDSTLWYATPFASPGSDPAFDQRPLDLRGTPAPDGGFFSGSYVLNIIGPGGALPLPPFTSDRIGTDGDRHAVSLESTTEGMELLTLFDLRPEGALPIAAAGADQVIECAGSDGATVTLDGSVSIDPARGPLEFTWLTSSQAVHGASPTLTLPIGTTRVDLWVRSEAGLIDQDSVTITVRDTTAPTLAVAATPDSLFPPNGRMVPVTFDLAARDRCDAAPAVKLIAVTSGDPRADSDRNVAGAEIGTDDRSLSLRARRTARIYQVTYEAEDASGNRTLTTLAVPVSRTPAR